MESPALPGGTGDRRSQRMLAGLLEARGQLDQLGLVLARNRD